MQGAITPAVIQKGFDRFWADVVAKWDFDPARYADRSRLEAQREAIRADITRAPLLAGWRDENDEIHFRDIEVEETVDDEDLVREIVRRIELGQPFTSIFYYDVHGVRVAPVSLAGNLYAGNMQERLEVTLQQTGIDDATIRSAYERDDISAMHELFADHLVVESHEREDSSGDREHYAPTVVVAAVLISRRLYQSTSPQFDPTLAQRLQDARIYWGGELEELCPEPDGCIDRTPDQIVAMWLESVENKLAEFEVKAYGPNSRVGKEAVDRRERAEGRLSPLCDRWTYEELEMWTVDALPRMSDATLCRLIVAHGGFELTQPCETIPRDELLPFAQQAARGIPKRPLCAILAEAGIVPPTPEKWSDIQWYNLQHMASYVPLEILSQIAQLSRRPEDSYNFSRNEVLNYKYRPHEGADWVVVERAQEIESIPPSYLRTYVGRPPRDVRELLLLDLQRQLGGWDVDVRPLSLRSSDPPLYISTWIHWSSRLDRNLDRGRVALLVLSGRLTISPVSTVTYSRLRGEDIIESERSGASVLPASILVLEAGDLLVVKFEVHPSGEIFDLLVVRSDAPESRWLRIHLH